MTGTPKSFCVLENASCLIWNYLKNGFASTQFLFFLFFRFHLPWSWKKDDDRNQKKGFLSLKMLRAWSEIIWKMALQVRSFCFFFFSALRTSNCANSRYRFLYLHPRFSYIFHLTAVTWVLVFNIDTAERNERQTNLNDASPGFATLRPFESVWKGFVTHLQ